MAVARFDLPRMPDWPRLMALAICCQMKLPLTAAWPTIGFWPMLSNVSGTKPGIEITTFQVPTAEPFEILTTSELPLVPV